MPVAYPTVIFFHKDVGVILEFTIKDNAGNVRNLGSSTLTLIVVDMGGTAITGSPFSMTVSDAANGKVQRTVASNDFAKGTYRAQVKEVVGTDTFYSDIFYIQVSEALA